MKEKAAKRFTATPFGKDKMWAEKQIALFYLMYGNILYNTTLPVSSINWREEKVYEV